MLVDENGTRIKNSVFFDTLVKKRQASVVNRLIVWLVSWLIGSLVRLVRWLGWFNG